MIKHLLRQSIRLMPWRLRDSIKRIPVVAQLQRRIVSQFLNGDEFVHIVDAGPAKGLVFPVRLPDDKNVWTGTYEVDFVTELVSHVEPDCICFDVGGWRGFCGGAMAVSGGRRIVIFEPLPENSQRIRRMIDLNPELPLQLVEAAAGRADGEAMFTLMGETSMGKLDSSSFQQDVQSMDTIDVNVVSLDSWCEKNNVDFPSVMKVDVEGAEVMVLEGARQILATSKPKLLIEAHSRQLAAEVNQLLSRFGYTIKTHQTGGPTIGSRNSEVCHIVAV